MYLKFILNQIANIIFTTIFATYYFESLVGQNRKFKKKSNWNMPGTPSKMHMYDMVKIDTIVFEIVGGWVALKAPPPQ